MPIPIPTSSVAAKFAQVIESLRFMVPKFIAKDRNAGPLIILIWSHLGRLGRQFAALAARAEAGTLRAASLRRPEVPCVGTRRAGVARVPSGLPTKFAWLGNMMWETRIFGGYLQQMVLNDPEMAALIAASPAGGAYRAVDPLDDLPIPGSRHSPRDPAKKAPSFSPALEEGAGGGVASAGGLAVDRLKQEEPLPRSLPQGAG